MMACDCSDYNYWGLSSELLPNLVRSICRFTTAELRLPPENNGHPPLLLVEIVLYSFCNYRSIKMNYFAFIL